MDRNYHTSGYIQLSNEYNLKDSKIVLKIIIIGKMATGKTSLMNRFIDQTFTEKYEPNIGIEFGVKNVLVNDIVIRLQIWDCNGKERPPSSRKSGPPYRGFHGCLLVYDVMNEESFKNIERKKTDFLSTSCSCPIILIANKIDLFIVFTGYCREVATFIPLELIDLIHKYYGGTRNGKVYAMENNMSFYETSAKTGYNVNGVFEEIAIKAFQYCKSEDIMVYNPVNNNDDIISLNKNDNGRNIACKCLCNVF
eukprot:382298_1